MTQRIGKIVYDYNVENNTAIPGNLSHWGRGIGKNRQS